MRADRRVDAAARAFRGAHDLVQALAHAVQALELEARAVRARHRQHGGDAVGVVRGELRIEPVAPVEQHPRAADPRRIGRGLSGEDRELRHARLLRALDLGVPIGALDEPDHQAPVMAFGQRVQMRNHLRRAPRIRLHDHAEAVPAGERGIGQQRLDHVERQL